MSKSLGNAIGINEPPAEMYGKLMSISDELMWKYWELLTDYRQSEVDRMRQLVTAGREHPMMAKMLLARKIVFDFHSDAEATKASEEWSQLFQKNEIPDDVERVTVAAAEVGWKVNQPVRLDKLLVAMGLASSNSEAQRKIKEGAVEIKGIGSRITGFVPAIPPPTTMAPMRLGKRAKVAVIV
jgi:tyrosyl-tRNA synthetase